MPTSDPITTDRLIASIREGIATQPALTAQARPVADSFTTLIHYRLPKVTAADGDLMIHIAAFLADVMTALTAAGDAPVDAITTATSAIAIAGLKLHDSGETPTADDDAETADAAARLRAWFQAEGPLVMDEEDLDDVQKVLAAYERGRTAQPANGDPCAVCYCRGCPQCVSLTPPSEVCFCRKAMRPEPAKADEHQPPETPTVPGPQSERKISDAAIRAYAAVLIQDYAAGLDYLDLAEHMFVDTSIGGVLLADLDGPEIDDVQRRILSAAHTAAIASSWPHSRQDAPNRAAVEAAETTGGEQAQGAAGRVGAFLDDWPHGDVVWFANAEDVAPLTIADLCTVLAELERLAPVEHELVARKREDRNVDRTLALLLTRLGGDVEFSRVEMEAAPRHGEFVTMQTVTGGMRLAFQAAAEARAELVTWCRIMCVGPACAKPCDDCRRDSARNAKMPSEIRASVTAARAEFGLPPETGNKS